MKTSSSLPATAALLCLPAVLAQTTLNTANFIAQFADGSGVLQSLVPTSLTSFDFSPSDYFPYRNGSGNYHTGDLGLRFRTSGNATWANAETAANRAATIQVTNQNGQYVSDLTPALPGTQGLLTVTRAWSDLDGDLSLQYTISNVGQSSVEIGALGMPIEFNNIFDNRTAVDTNNKCVLIDPYIGLHAGYAQATRLTGTGPDLVMTPLTPDTKFEGWRFLDEPENDAVPYQQQTYEGNYEWDVFTQAFVDNEWSNAQPWNPPTSKVLQPNQTVTVGLRFAVAPSVQEIESTVSSQNVPVAVGIPGYVLPADINGRLFINTNQTITSVVADPAGSITFQADADVGGSKAYTVNAGSGAFGRARLVLTFDDGRQMVVHYHLAKSAADTVAGLGTFLTTNQWYTDSSDVFNRSPSVISYDHEVGDFVLQENRAWIAGLSDEGGAGSFLTAGMKQGFTAAQAEVAKLEDFVNQTVWGNLQISSGAQQYAVRKSLFFYEPDLVPGYQYSSDIYWPGTWDQPASFATDRGYDYVHVSNIYFSLYAAGKAHPGILTVQTATWYLTQAYQTVIYIYNDANEVGYGDLGLMGETIWGYILAALYDEGMTDEAANFESIMQGRQQVWAGRDNPFGSEMAWDSTGQEGVYYWSNYFNDTVTAQKTIASIRGFMPTIAHWGYNGNARRYWDFLYGGKYPGIERQLHHYGSGLNSLPLFENYRQLPDPSSLESIYDLRVAYGGNQGPLCNIQEDGFASMAFHGYPENLFPDPYSGDYGPNFVGHSLGVGTYIVEHPTFGWVSFGGNIVSSDGDIVVEPKDTLRKRVFVAPVGAFVTLNAGTFTQITWSPASGQITLEIQQGENSDTSFPAPNATLSVLQGGVGKTVTPVGLQGSGGKYVVDFTGGATQKVVLDSA